MHDYAMLAHGDRVLLGVSGGIDSSVLAWLLHKWQAKAPISYTVKAVYIDNGFWQKEHGGGPPAETIAEMMAGFGIEFQTVKAKIKQQEFTCYLCAKNRRSQLFDLARRWQMNKIAFGHHLDDLLETLFLNMIYSGNISTMVPKQALFEGKLHIIRPMAYLEKNEVRKLADEAQVVAVKSYCPLEKDTQRATVRGLLADIYSREPGAKKSLFQAMKNIRQDYLLEK